MCGIAGWLNLNGKGIDREVVAKMVWLQAHRGPDGEGIFFDNGKTCEWTEFEGRWRHFTSLTVKASSQYQIGLGHRRLSIIDLSSAGHQPMRDRTGRYWITYNGEVYNYLELRRELQDGGYEFYSHTDTEVILAAYETWGTSCLSRFNGMWALAIWDTRERELFCARDRFGVKPFYYHWNTQDFIFASEIKAVLVCSQVSNTLNDSVILDYLLGGSVDHLPGNTFFREIKQLLPGHYAIIKDGKLWMERFWEMPVFEKKRPVTQDLVEECRTLLLDATRLRLRSDVPVGGTLSGGIDSTTLTCLVDQRLSTQPYHVFSTQFAGHVNDESQYVSDVMAGARHLQLHLTLPTSQELMDTLTKLMWHQDEPFGDTSIFAHYCLMQLARAHGIKVVLTGQGADEIFSGYWSYYRAWLGQLLVEGRLALLQREIQVRRRITGETHASLYQAAIYHALPAQLRTQIQSARLYRQANWLNPEFKQSVRRERFDPAPTGWSRFDWYLYESLTKWSVPHLVHHDDRNSMAFGVESRAPFLDYRLVQFLFSTADGAKHADGRMKVLLRRAGEGIIPPSVTSRNDKIGFYTPMAQWLTGAREFAYDLLGTDFARKNPYFSTDSFVPMVEDVLAGNARHASQVWWGLSLCLWHEVMIKQNQSAVEGKTALAQQAGA